MAQSWQRTSVGICEKEEGWDEGEGSRQIIDDTEDEKEKVMIGACGACSLEKCKEEAFVVGRFLEFVDHGYRI